MSNNINVDEYINKPPRKIASMREFDAIREQESETLREGSKVYLVINKDWKVKAVDQIGRWIDIEILEIEGGE